MKSRRALKNVRDETALFRRRALVGFVLLTIGRSERLVAR